MHFHGLGTEQSDEKAFYAYQAAALQNHPHACRNLVRNRCSPVLFLRTLTPTPVPMYAGLHVPPRPRLCQVRGERGVLPEAGQPTREPTGLMPNDLNYQKKFLRMYWPAWCISIFILYA